MNGKIVRYGLGIAAGGALAALLDPIYGRRRRAMLRDRLARGATSLIEGAGVVWRDSRNRARGLAADAASFARRSPVADVVLVERVRSKLGRVISNPGAVAVSAKDGRVTIAGPVFEDEADAAVACVSRVRGAREVEDRLDRHAEASGVPELQGGRRQTETTFEYRQRRWSPTARVAAGAAGAGLAAWGVRRGGLLGWASAALGTGIAARGATNREIKRLLGLGPARAAFEIHRAITVDAPAGDVFEFWADAVNFPRFMSHVREVRDEGNGRSHWVVDGPAGVPVSWNAVRTAFIPNQLLAWKSEPGAAVHNAGFVLFDATADGRTRIRIRMTYKPPAGALGRTVAMLLGTDPLKLVNDDLLRFQSLIETGKTTANGRKIRRERIRPVSRADDAPAAAAEPSAAEGTAAVAVDRKLRPVRPRKPRPRPLPPEPSV